MEDDLRWKKTFDRRQPSMEDILQWKTTDGGRVIMGEVSLQKSFPYSGRMCRLLRRRSDYCHRVAIFFKQEGYSVSPKETQPLPILFIG